MDTMTKTTIQEKVKRIEVLLAELSELLRESYARTDTPLPRLPEKMP